MAAPQKGESRMSTLDRYSPSTGGVRDPRDTAKRSGMFWNFPRYLYLGGAKGAPMQAGTKGPDVRAASGQDAARPISDRGKGRSR
jgi:hypothetical protein